MENEKLKKEIGERLKQLRNSLGLKQKDFAEACSTSPSFISDVEKGKSHLSINLLMALKVKFNIEYDYLLNGKNTEIRNSEISEYEITDNIKTNVLSNSEKAKDEQIRELEIKVAMLSAKLEVYEQMLDKMIGSKANSLAEVGAVGNNPNYLDFNIGSQLRAIAAEPKVSYSADNGTKNK